MVQLALSNPAAAETCILLSSFERHFERISQVLTYTCTRFFDRQARGTLIDLTNKELPQLLSRLENRQSNRATLIRTAFRNSVSVLFGRP